MDRPDPFLTTFTLVNKLIANITLKKCAVTSLPLNHLLEKTTQKPNSTNWLLSISFLVSRNQKDSHILTRIQFNLSIRKQQRYKMYRPRTAMTTKSSMQTSSTLKNYRNYMKTFWSKNTYLLLRSRKLALLSICKRKSSGLPEMTPASSMNFLDYLILIN